MKNYAAIEERDSRLWIVRPDRELKVFHIMKKPGILIHFIYFCFTIPLFHCELITTVSALILDVNECAIQGICNNGQCVNAQGGFQCECTSGYALDSEGKDCIGKEYFFILLARFFSRKEFS